MNHTLYGGQNQLQMLGCVELNFENTLALEIPAESDDQRFGYLTM